MFSFQPSLLPKKENQTEFNQRSTQIAKEIQFVWFIIFIHNKIPKQNQEV